MQLLPGFRSDHSLINFCFSIDTVNGGKGLWKFNCKLLENLEFVAKMNDRIDNCNNNETALGLRVY